MEREVVTIFSGLALGEFGCVSLGWSGELRLIICVGLVFEETWGVGLVRSLAI